MNTTFSEMIDRLTATTPEQEDYTGEDGLLYCGKCHKPKEAYFAPDKAAVFGRDSHPAECDCQRAAREEREAAEKRQKHLDTVEDLKRRGFTDPAMRDWTFENDNGQNPQAIRARNYVKNWERAYAGNVGCLFWGSVGTGKSYLAGCIANALMEKEIPVYMTNFALILNDLAASFEGRNEYISRLCRYPLLILDDFGMERGTEYGLEQVFHVIDSRYRSRKPKEAYFAPDKAAIFGRDRHPAECDCQRTAREEREAAEKRRRHLDTVEELKRRGFTDPTMRDWTFENDNGRNPQTGLARRYVEHWEDMRTDNIGCLFWGGVGTGKSYLAGCIANALMEKEIPVRMTNFALILNDLAASFEGRNEYISRLCRYPLLILDDFGMERGTEYGLEQVFNVIDSRYRSGKPLIVTTNLTLDDLHNPEDTAHSRIYDRLLSMCVPVRFTGDNFRQETAKRKMESMKKLITD